MNILEKQLDKSDEELAVFSINSHEAFALLVDRYKNKLLRYIKRMSNLNDDDAKDILQDIFLKVYLNLNAFDSSLKFSSWLYSIARNQIISSYRKTKIRPEGNINHVDDVFLEKLASNTNIEEHFDNKILTNKIIKTLNSLKDKWREILILRFFEEKDYNEISEIIKKPSGTVASMLNKAKKEFKEKYEKIN